MVGALGAVGQWGHRPRGAQRLVPVSGDEFFIVVPWMTGAIAYRIRRNLGGSAGTDVGSPYQTWRRTGVRVLSALAGDPASPLATLSDDIGAFDYAMQEATGAFRFGGSYHGGETATPQVLADDRPVDPASPQRARRFSLTHSSIIDYGGGRTIAVTYRLDFNADGSLSESTSFSSSAALASGQFPHMEIGSSAFTRALVGPQMSDCSVAGDTALGSAGDVTLLDPATGYTIRCNSDAPTILGANYNSTFITRLSAPARSKIYYRRNSTAGAALGSYSVSRSLIYGQRAAAILNADFAADLDGFSNVGAVNGVWTSANGGAVRQTRSATLESRITRAMTCEIGRQYAIHYSYSLGGGATTHAGGRVVVGLQSNGSTTGALANDLVNAAANQRIVFTATQAIHWLTLRQEAGTAGETIDWRFVTVLPM